MSITPRRCEPDRLRAARGERAIRQGALRRVAIAGLIVCALVLAAPPLAGAAEDATPPQITAFEIAPKTVNTQTADQTLTVTMTLTDDQAGVASLYDNPPIGSVTQSPSQLMMKPDAGGTQTAYANLVRDVGTDLYRATVTLPKGSKEGPWAVISLYLVDKLGNSVTLNAAQLETLFDPGCAHITNEATSSDSTPPEITAFSISPATINTETADQTITITATITDDQAGVASLGDNPPVGNIYRSPSQLQVKPDAGGTQTGYGNLAREDGGTDLDGVYTAAIVLPRGSREGVWSTTMLYLVDKLGNETWFNAAALQVKFPGAVSFTNAATTSDSTPPQITAFSITPTEVSTENGDQTLTVTMTLTDDMAGVASQGDNPPVGNVTNSPTQFMLQPLIGTQAAYGMPALTFGNDRDGVYRATVTLPKSAKEGIWTVASIMLIDKLGNAAYFNTDALNALLPDAEGLTVANTAQADQVTIEREWTISTASSSVTFPVGTVVTRKDGGKFAFYRMASHEFTVDNSVPTTGLDGVPIAGLRLGIPGLNLSFDRPVTVTITVGEQYNGYRLAIESLGEGGAAWANETETMVANGRCSFTVSHATYFAASIVRKKCKVTLAISGLRKGAIKARKSLTLKGAVTPVPLTSPKAKLTVQKKRGSKWVNAKVVLRPIGTKGAYIWKYKPSAKGRYRVQASVAATKTNLSTKTAWRAFKVN
jgi:hypothetical protein